MAYGNIACAYNKFLIHSLPFEDISCPLVIQCITLKNKRKYMLIHLVVAFWLPPSINKIEYKCLLKKSEIKTQYL